MDQRIILDANALCRVSRLDNTHVHQNKTIKIVGQNTDKKNQLLNKLIGLPINLTFPRTLIISVNKTLEPDTFVRPNGFINNTYRLKNVVKRLQEEQTVDLDKPFRLDIYSPDVTNQFTVIIDNNGNYFGDCIEFDSDKTDINKFIEDYDKGKQLVPFTNKLENTESYEFYRSIAEPYALRQDKTLFLNIISGKSGEEILYECDDFVLVRDILWKGDIENLRCIIIFKDTKLMSIRNLTGQHQDLLNNALKTGKTVLAKLFDINKITLETYFHYYPSVWLLHMHFVSSTIEEKHKKFHVETVLENLQKDSNYYKTNDLVLE